jgi:K+-sensing histidine kinase KdpD
LYDIDLIIRRTAVYAVLTASLGIIYFGTVVLMQTIIGRAADEQSPLVIVFSTLLIAALFSPLRRRIQSFIDRRFYRRKYDAAQILAQFSQTAQNEVDMERLSAVLIKVVEETMQPEQTSLWLKQTKGIR